MGKGGQNSVGVRRTKLQALKDIITWNSEGVKNPTVTAQWGGSGEPAASRRLREEKPSAAKKGTKVKKGSTDITLAEVAKHNTKDDAWIVIRGKVYDVTEFSPAHPGGDVIYTWAGKDATEVFSVFHATSSWSLLEPMKVGELSEEDAKLSGIVSDFRKLRADMISEGLFKSNKAYYAMKCIVQLMILGLSLSIIWRSDSWGAVTASAFVMGLFWQQCGWLAHDFLHHQVFQNREYNNYVGYFWGNLMQGFSVGWWKSKHNTHHAATNELDHHHSAVDPDIDTLPILAWSKEMLDTVEHRAHRAIMSFQHYIFFPVLLFARISWAQQSYAFARHSPLVKPEKRALEVGGIALHYFWLLSYSFATLPALKACAYVVMCECFCGALLAIVFTLSHNGMDVFVNENTDFISAQAATTRNIDAGLFNDWFTGGLNRQIEHHLFPTLPRHNLGKIEGRVEALCLKHGLPYERCGMGSALARVLGCLKRIADIAATEYH